jgi:flagellar protein FlbD
VIDVTRLGGGALMVNVDLILSIEQTPDTMIAFSNGEKMLVRETPAVLVERLVAFRRRLGHPDHLGIADGTDGE